jgi:hypothetical protein
VAASNSATAAYWDLNASAYAQFEYNDNKRLEVGSHNTVYGSIYNLQADLRRKTERSNLRIAPRLRFDHYKGDEFLDADNKYLVASIDHNTERSYVALNIDYTRDTPLTSEFQENEFVRTNKPRNRWSASPNWTYQVNERNLFGLSLTYLDVQHEDADLTGLIDYHYLIGSAQHTYVLSEISKIKTRVYGSRYDTEDVEYVTNDGGVDFTFESQLAVTIDYLIRLGWHQVTTRSGRGESEVLDTEEGTLVGLTLINRFEKGNLKVSVENDIEPSNIGHLVNKTKGAFSIYNRIAERVSNYFSVADTHNKSVADLGATTKWELRQLTWRVNIKLSKFWGFDSTYRFFWQKYDYQEKSAQSNAIFFTLGYSSF